MSQGNLVCSIRFVFSRNVYDHTVWILSCLASFIFWGSSALRPRFPCTTVLVYIHYLLRMFRLFLNFCRLEESGLAARYSSSCGRLLSLLSGQWVAAERIAQSQRLFNFLKSHHVDFQSGVWWVPFYRLTQSVTVPVPPILTSTCHVWKLVSLIRVSGTMVSHRPFTLIWTSF